MSVDSVLLWSSFGCKTVLVLLYLAVIIHAKRGTQYTFVYVVAGMMMVSDSAGGLLQLIVFDA